MTPRVSIVLPIYNYARYLDERMTSLLEQTCEDFELIAVDDGSTDDSRTVVAKYLGDPRVRTLWFDVNGGLPYLRWNDGAAVARGEYVLFAGADDSCERTMLEVLVGLLDRHPGAGLAHVRSWVVDPAGHRVRLLPTGARWATDFVATCQDEAPFLMAKNTMPNASAMLLRRSVFEACGRFDTSMRLCADYKLWVRMLLVSDVAYSAQALNYFRKHPRTLRSVEGPGSLVLERYEILEEMLRVFAVSDEAREKGREQVAIEWADRLAHRRSPGAWRVDRQIYRAARRVDPGLHRRMTRLVGRNVLRALRGRAAS